MTQFLVKDTSNGNTRKCESRAEAEETRDDLISLGATPEDIVVESPEGEERANVTDNGAVVQQGGKPNNSVEAEHVDHTPEPDGGTTPEVVESDVPDDPSISDDPVDWMPGHFIDEIQGVPTVNRKGYAVIASKYGISVTAEPVTLPSETDFEYAEFRAVATTAEGDEYSGFGSAHVDRQDGDDAHLLAELAETRAMKRAVAWASGVGLTAIEEMKGEL